MADLRSPLAGRRVAGRYGASGGPPGVQLDEVALGCLVQVAGWGDAFADQIAPMLRRLGLADLGNFHDVQGDAEVRSFRIAPQRLLIQHQRPTELEAALAKLDTASTPLLDLTHARTVVAVEGSGSGDLLARLATLDFSVKAFQPGCFAQTAIHHTGVIILRESATRFLLYLPRSAAASLWDYICVNAEPLGYTVG